MRFIEKYPLTIILVLCAVLFSLLIILDSQDNPLNGDRTDCYDRSSNKIVGEVCIVEGQYDSVHERNIFNGTMSLLLIVFALSIGLLHDSMLRRIGKI